MGVFGDLNEVRLIGNITRDIELRKTNNGNSVANFTVATNRSYRQDDEWKEDVEFNNVVVWGSDAEFLSERAKKGTRIFVSGRLQTRSWESDGVTKYKTEVVANRTILLDRYEKGPSDDLDSNASSDSNKSENDSEENIDPSDLPF